MTHSRTSLLNTTALLKTLRIDFKLPDPRNLWACLI